MKSLIAIAVVFASAQAMALNPRSTWTQIFKANNAIASTQHSAYMSGITLDNACLTATTVQTIKPVSVCTDLRAVEHAQRSEESAYTEYKCFKYNTQAIVLSRNYQVQICTDLRQVGHGEGSGLECFAYGMKSITIPAVENADVRVMDGEADQGFTCFTKSFTFPSCN